MERQKKNNKFKILIILFIIILLIVLFVVACSPKHFTDKEVLRYLEGEYHEKFEIVSKTKDKYKGDTASCEKEVTIYIWKVKSLDTGKEFEVKEYYTMKSYTCGYHLTDNYE